MFKTKKELFTYIIYALIQYTAPYFYGYVLKKSVNENYSVFGVAFSMVGIIGYKYGFKFVDRVYQNKPFFIFMLLLGIVLSIASLF